MKILNGTDKRKARVRYQVARKAYGRPRLSVFRSSKHIYAQIIDDAAGVTIASASTVDKDLKSTLKNGSTIDAAILIGKEVAKKAMEKGVKEVVFDRGSYIYHGRVKALADGAREIGLSF